MLPVFSFFFASRFSLRSAFFAFARSGTPGAWIASAAEAVTSEAAHLQKTAAGVAEKTAEAVQGEVRSASRRLSGGLQGGLPGRAGSSSHASQAAGSDSNARTDMPI